MGIYCNLPCFLVKAFYIIASEYDINVRQTVLVTSVFAPTLGLEQGYWNRCTLQKSSARAMTFLL